MDFPGGCLSGRTQDVFVANDEYQQVAAAYHVQQKRVEKAAKDIADEMKKELDACCPALEDLKDPQLIAQPALAERVVNNEHHGDISPLVLRIIPYLEALQIHDVLKPLQKDLTDMIHRGKMAIGVQYLLKKLEAIQVAEDRASQKAIAVAAMNKVREKGIVVSLAVQKACQHFADM